MLKILSDWDLPVNAEHWQYPGSPPFPVHYGDSSLSQLSLSSMLRKVKTTTNMPRRITKGRIPGYHFHKLANMKRILLVKEASTRVGED